uniref:Fibrinogen C-terminal domain-containing protein n=1 Tax=Macrostomum lignano TaxID=282301 RepID=A0A1I8FJ70_9PLAT
MSRFLLAVGFSLCLLTVVSAETASGGSLTECALKCKLQFLKGCSAAAFVPGTQQCLLADTTNADFPGGKTQFKSKAEHFKIIQHRSKGLLSFGRGWTEYEDGFGDETDFWIGLRKIHQLTGSSPKLLRVEAVTWSDELYVCEYSGFTVADASTNYTMTYTSYLSGSSNTTSDSLADNKGKQFSTIDRDNNQISSSCSAARGNSGWWFKSCTKSNPNGIYHASPRLAQSHLNLKPAANRLSAIHEINTPVQGALGLQVLQLHCGRPQQAVLLQKATPVHDIEFQSASFEHPAVLRALRFTSKRPVLCVSGDSVLIGSSIFTCGIRVAPDCADTLPDEVELRRRPLQPALAQQVVQICGGAAAQLRPAVSSGDLAHGFEAPGVLLGQGQLLLRGGGGRPRVTSESLQVAQRVVHRLGIFQSVALQFLGQLGHFADDSSGWRSGGGRGSGSRCGRFARQRRQLSQVNRQASLSSLQHRFAASGVAQHSLGVAMSPRMCQRPRLDSKCSHINMKAKLEADGGAAGAAAAGSGPVAAQQRRQLSQAGRRPAAAAEALAAALCALTCTAASLYCCCRCISTRSWGARLAAHGCCCCGGSGASRRSRRSGRFCGSSRSGGWQRAKARRRRQRGEVVACGSRTARSHGCDSLSVLRQNAAHAPGPCRSRRPPAPSSAAACRPPGGPPAPGGEASARGAAVSLPQVEQPVAAVAAAEAAELLEGPVASVSAAAERSGHVFRRLERALTASSNWRCTAEQLERLLGLASGFCGSGGRAVLARPLLKQGHHLRARPRQLKRQAAPPGPAPPAALWPPETAAETAAGASEAGAAASPRQQGGPLRASVMAEFNVCTLRSNRRRFDGSSVAASRRWLAGEAFGNQSGQVRLRRRRLPRRRWRWLGDFEGRAAGRSSTRLIKQFGIILINVDVIIVRQIVVIGSGSQGPRLGFARRRRRQQVLAAFSGDLWRVELSFSSASRSASSYNSAVEALFESAAESSGPRRPSSWPSSQFSGGLAPAMLAGGS